MKTVLLLLLLLLNLVPVAGANAIAGEKSVSGHFTWPGSEYWEKPVVSDGKDREKGCPANNFTPDEVVVENNLFGGNEESQTDWIRKHGIDMASCADAPGSASCQKAINERDAVGLALATGSVSLLPGGAQAMWGLGAEANAGISYLVDGTVDPTTAVIGGWVNVISAGNGVVGTVGWNAAGGALGNWLEEKDPTSGAILNGAGSLFGYGIGNGLKWGVNAGANWWKGGWDPKFNADLRQFTEVKGYYGISKEIKPSNVPSSVGDIGGSVASEAGGKYIEYKMKKEGANK